MNNDYKLKLMLMEATTIACEKCNEKDSITCLKICRINMIRDYVLNHEDSESDNQIIKNHTPMEKRLVTTEEASTITGLSAFELRRGYKTGKYPAVELGGGSRSHRYRWDIEKLNDAIRKEMFKNDQTGD